MFTSFAQSEHPSFRSSTATLVAACLFAWLVFAPLTAARADELQDVSKLVSTGKIDEAEKRADAFLVKTPKDAQMRFLKGVILAQRGKRDEAVALFTGLSQDYPELPEPYNNLAVIYAAQGQYDKARDALESSIRVSPNYATAYENLGDVYAALAARSYQDARRTDGNNAAALRKLNAARALLAGTGAPAAPVVAPAAAAPVDVAAAEITRSQRNVGLPSPAGPSVNVAGAGATAPEIVVPSTAVSVPQGSNVVAIETSPARERRNDTSLLSDAKTVVAGDPVQPAADVGSVTASVQRWARSKALTTSELSVRVDGDAAVARFHAVTQAVRKRPAVGSDRTLTLKRDGAAWTVTDEKTAS